MLATAYQPEVEAVSALFFRRGRPAKAGVGEGKENEGKIRPSARVVFVLQEHSFATGSSC